MLLQWTAKRQNPCEQGLDVCRKLERMNLAQVCDWLQYASDQVADTS